MNICYIVMGASRSGKDTVAGILRSMDSNLVSIKFSAPMKRRLEQEHRLPPGSLEEPETRESRVTMLGETTYLDLMVRAAKHWRAVDPFCMVRQVLPGIETAMTYNRGLIFTDIRFRNEMLAVFKMCRDFQYPIHMLFVVGRGQRLPSDIEALDELVPYLESQADRVSVITNRGSYEELEIQVKRAAKV